jgi:endonuclease/exonuclease/phosphatase family metal-dependent hydrolase
MLPRAAHLSHRGPHAQCRRGWSAGPVCLWIARNFQLVDSALECSRERTVLGRLGLKTTLGAARALPIIVTHLQSGLLPQDSADRITQLGALLPWTSSQGSPRVLVCDCNANPMTPEYQQLHAMYHDAWADAVAAGTAKGRMDGITHKSSRIDYVFFDPGSSLQLVSMENVETPALIGVEASDHRPQVATFTLK